LLALDRAIPLVLSSSIQAELDNPYGVSKRGAEQAVSQYAEQCGAQAIIYRLTNVFGKWCRPNYNSVVATFCYNIARGLPITISDRARGLDLIHVDDVVAAFVGELDTIASGSVIYKDIKPTYHVLLGQLADLLTVFRRMRQNLMIPNFGDVFTHKLYGTYLSYLEPDDFAYKLEQRCDPRGCLAEFVKAEPFGQIFVSRTLPGITRGNHYHHVKTEKFLVLEGEAVVRFRHIEGGEMIEYPVQGTEFKVVDIPPGYTHSIENVGDGELITLFWASEIFDPSRPDTVYEEV
jgi:UDP-2-acetamido-2,6-beta-L-arabino-hexul-4-ose reductase